MFDLPIIQLFLTSTMDSFGGGNYDGVQVPTVDDSTARNSAEFDSPFEPFGRERANTWHAGLLYQGEVCWQTLNSLFFLFNSYLGIYLSFMQDSGDDL